jgi:hypothetical protein
MPRARVVLLALAALLGGALLGALLVQPGAAPTLGGRSGALEVVVENEGSRSARAVIELTRLGGGAPSRSDLALPAGASVSPTFNGYSGDVFVKLTVSWAEGARSAQGDQGVIVDPGECGGDERMRVTFRVATSNGVSFSPAERGCA